MASQRVTSLRRRAQASAPTASYWLGRVLDDAGRQEKTSPLCKGCRGRNLQCTLALCGHETVNLLYAPPCRVSY